MSDDKEATTAVNASAATDDEPQEDEDEELEAMKRKVKEMQEETARLEQIQKQVEEQLTSGDANSDIDLRSVFVGNVDYGATPEELQTHFKDCGTINRITILCDKYTGHPKGFAYVEFAEKESVTKAEALNESVFRGRQLKVTAKRTNVPGMSARGRGRGRGYMAAPYYAPRGRGARGGYFAPGPFRGRGGRRPYWAPY